MFICRRNTLPVSKAKGLGWAWNPLLSGQRQKTKESDGRRYKGTQEQAEGKWRGQSGCLPPLSWGGGITPGASLRDQFLILRWTQTLSLSVEPARRDTGFCCPHFQLLISGTSSPCS